MIEKGTITGDGSSSRKRNDDGDNRSVKRNRKTTSDLQFVRVDRNESGDDDVEAKERESGDDKNIKIKTITGKIVSFKVKSSDTIGSLKLKIQAKEHIPFEQQELFFNEKVLENFNTFANLPINTESTITLMSISKGFINISIKTPEGRTIHTFEVKHSDTIGDVKAKIPGSGHVLMFNGTVLDDSATLADFNIVNGSALTLPDKLVGLMEIFVNTFTGKTITLSVTPTLTIYDVKSMVVSEEGIPYDEQALIFNNVVLGDDGTLSDFNINTNSTLTLMRISKGFMDIFTKTFTGKTITLKVKPLDTIECIKAKIQIQEDIPSDEQELIFNEMVLHNNGTLADFHINKESTLTLMRLLSGLTRIYIKTQTGKTVTLDVKPSDTIYRVKVKIYEKEGIRPCEQILIWNGKQLLDDPTLADYHVPTKSTFNLALRLRGC